MTKPTTVKIASHHQRNLWTALSDLSCASSFTQQLLMDHGHAELVALLALIQKVGATLETTLFESQILDAPGVVGGAADWLRIAKNEHDEAEEDQQ